MPNTSRPSAPRGWPVWPATWAAILGSSLVGAGLLGGLSLAGERRALEAALASHLVAVGGAADGALPDLPVETLVALGGTQSGATLADRVDNLATHGGLRGLALIDPERQVIGHGGRWVPLAAEEYLVAQARAGAPGAGWTWGISAFHALGGGARRWR